MAITTYKPNTPGQRGMTTQDFDGITAKKPLKSLTTVKKKNSGRNNHGHITTRHQGGGVRQFYRKVNFDLPAGTQAVIEEIE
jgi:large subunit ribosomal protein L2